MGKAVLDSKVSLGNNNHILNFKMNEDLGFIGGMYIIIDSKIPLKSQPIETSDNEKKNYKRAYTIISPESKQREFSFAYKSIDAGVVTKGLLDNIEVGTEIKFSGPWGKFLKVDDYAKSGEVLIIATDTGIATALGFIQSSKIKDRLEDVVLKWYVPSEEYFFSFNQIREMIPANIGRFDIIISPEYGNGRGDEFYQHINKILFTSEAKAYYLCGDGRVVKKGRDYLIGLGVPTEQIGTKTYFNKEAN